MGNEGETKTKLSSGWIYNMEKWSFFSHLLSSHVPIKQTRKVCHPKTSFANQRKNPHVRKQTSVSISHLQYPRHAQKPPKDISSTQDAHSPGVTVVWYHHMPLLLQPPQPTASLFHLPTYLIRTRTAARGSYLNSQLTLSCSYKHNLGKANQLPVK